MYDAVIVGAGPSGCTAALYAQRYGLKTLLLDKAAFPRDKVCGDALSGKSVRILKELDLLDEAGELEGPAPTITASYIMGCFVEVNPEGRENNTETKIINCSQGKE